jgi:rhodanese-related sulfurtransferase
LKEVSQFLLAHWPLSLAFLVTLVAIIFFEIRDRQSGGRRVNCTELTRLINHEKAVVVDMRDANDFGQGHIIGALNITANNLKDHQAKLSKMNSRPVVVVDNTGSQVGAMLKLLSQAGLNVYYLTGGLNAWRQDGLPLTTAVEEV